LIIGPESANFDYSSYYDPLLPNITLTQSSNGAYLLDSVSFGGFDESNMTGYFIPIGYPNLE